MKSCTNPYGSQKNPQPFENFNKNKKGKNGLYCHCKFCQRKTNKHRYDTREGRLKRWQYTLKKFYWPTLTPEQAYERYCQLLHLQKHVCKICRLPETEVDAYGDVKPLNVDHCHYTQQVRGLLCGCCNRGIGQLKDSAKLCLKAHKYLKSFEKSLK